MKIAVRPFCGTTRLVNFKNEFGAAGALIG